MKMFRPFGVFVVIFLLVSVGQSAIRTWDGGGADANWTTAANWVGDVAPVANDDLVFPATAAQFTTNNNFTLLTSFRSISVEGGAYTIGGSLFRLSAGLTVQSGSLTVNTAITLNGAQTFSSGTAGTITLLGLSVGSSQLTIDGDGITGIGLISGSGGVIKNGSGAAAIIAASGFSGPLTLNNGILVVDATIPNSTVTVNSDLTTGGQNISGLGGTGTVGPVNVIEGIVSAGSLTSPTGILSINGGLTMSSSGAFAPKLGGTTPGTGHDRLNVTGVVTFNNSLLAPIPWNNFEPAIGDAFIILGNDGSDPVTGTFLNLPEGAIFAGPLGTAFRISYVAGDGNDIAITRVPNADFDFDGDGRSDVGTYDGTTWNILQSGSGTTVTTQFGIATDLITPADFDGDNRTDIAVFRPENGFWYVLNSSTSTVDFVQFGALGDIPVPNDMDGDGRADKVVFRPSNGVWYQLLSLGGQFAAVQFGQDGDVPQVADIDGDGFGDPSIFRPADGTWHFLRSSDSGYTAFPFGQAGDKPIMADFNGDGLTDVGIFRPSDDPSQPDFYTLTSGTFVYSGVSWGSPGDIPVVADYDGDGRADFGVFRPSDGTWYLLRSTSGFAAVPFGSSGDRPLPAAYVR